MRRIVRLLLVLHATVDSFQWKATMIDYQRGTFQHRRAAALTSMSTSRLKKTLLDGVSPPRSTMEDWSSNSKRKVASSSSRERAGADGYSILRQPLQWDTSQDEGGNDSGNDQRKNTNLESYQSLAAGRGDARRGGGMSPLRNTQVAWSPANGRHNSLSGSPSMHYKDQFLQHNNKDDDTKTTSIQNTIDNVNLHTRTMETLDYPQILQALASCCTTIPARQIIFDTLHDSTNHGGSSQPQHGGRRDDEPDSDSPHYTHHKDNIQDNDIQTMRLSANNVHEVHSRYAAVQEMHLARKQQQQQHQKKQRRTTTKMNVITPFPLSLQQSNTLNIQPILDKGSEYGRILEANDIIDCVSILRTLEELSMWCQQLLLFDRSMNNSSLLKSPSPTINPSFVELPKLGDYITINTELRDLLDNAFDINNNKDGQELFLNGETFPSIGQLRLKIKQMKNDILDIVNTLTVAGQGTTSSLSTITSNKLALESGGSLLSEINGRIVIPVQEKYKNSIGSGIVHDVSRSGRTIYVEPQEIVGLTNDMKQVEMELRQEEIRVWKMLTERIMDHKEEIEISVAAAAQLDLVFARVLLGDAIQGVVPVVGSEGVMYLEYAKHPVLLLREVKNVVGNTISLGAAGNQGLVLTGPNSGGKTIILKLMGLVALMVRDGIPIPAAQAGARVDFFAPVLADIGDIQSVGGDLSTFSGHMLVCREVLAKAGNNSLVLMDELGSGTDPSQGVAIAQALLEALVNVGARVAITTHYLELKQLAASDARFAVGGMQFVNGRPTYKLLPGTVGESFALAVAERLNLPPSIIQRANELLDSDTRKMGDLIRELEDQKASIDQQVIDLTRKQRDMDGMKADMERAKARLEQQQLNARREEAKKFAEKLEEKERVLEEVLQKLQSNPSKRVVARSWDDVKILKSEALREAEFTPGRPRVLPADSKVLIPVTDLENPPTLEVGATIIVCKPGAAMGKQGVIQKLGPKSIEAAVGAMPLRLKMSEIALPSRAMVESAALPSTAQLQRRNLAKAARKAIEENDTIEGTSNGRHIDQVQESKSMMRMSSNTLDLRGCDLLESKTRAIDFFATSAATPGRSVVYLLHGHGSEGVLKRKLRDWLNRERQWSKRWKPADASDGGDAFTMVELKKIEY